MLKVGKAVKVSIYLSEGSTHHGMSSYLSILDFLFFRGVSGATVLKGVAGFGAGEGKSLCERWRCKAYRHQRGNEGELGFRNHSVIS